MSVVFFNVSPVTGIYFDPEQPAIFVGYRERQAQMIREMNDIVLARKNEHFCFRKMWGGRRPRPIITIPIFCAIAVMGYI